ncbi:MAG: ferrous iron transporter B [Clostridia bacterium]|nr:ferrous iron transporter B [Clostridia bacterium]
MRIALAGNPNSGKTTMYNALTGQNEKVGNWAGVTVEKKEHPIKKRLYKDGELIAVDLPGAYSMSPFTSEESITNDYIKNETPDVIINIVDGTNLSRSLFFTTQLLELGIPVVVALNKSDINKKRETKIDVAELEKRLGCKVVETASKSASGVARLVEAAVSSVGKTQNAPYVQKGVDVTSKESVEADDRKRFAFVNEIVSSVETRKTFSKNKNFQDKIDTVLTNKWVGLPIFALIMFLVFGISQAWLGPWVADTFCGWLEAGKELIALALSNEAGELGIWASILVEGIIGGVIAVIGFLPLVMIMYFLIALLEDCGYMARATVVLDPIFKKVGLSGKSVIPFVVGTGCTVPGVMACRTIRDERERRAAVMLTPFMPCGAKLPVISLFAGAFFGKSAWVGTLMYFMGIAIILVAALLVNSITGNKKKRSYFIIELPEYKLPSVPRATMSMLGRGWSFIVKAGTVILVCNFVVHVMQTFNWRFSPVSDAADSILHDIATPFAYAIAPLIGVVAWEFAAAAITGFIAKENVVGTLAVCFGISNLINLDELEMTGSATAVSEAFGIGAVAGLAYLIFTLFSPPCFAALAAMNSEMKSKKWFFAGIGLQFAVGYTVSFITFFFGMLFTRQAFASLWIPIVGWSVVILISALLAFLIIRKKVQEKSSNPSSPKKESARV